jgi:3alpha(or 20beta)-hydroxysteroid dehydrogenase
MQNLTGSTVLVTGGARGIGAATARAFVDAGAYVVVADVLDDAGAALVAELGEERATYVHLDVTDADGWTHALEHAESTFGAIRVLVNNAGIVDFGAIDDQTPKAFRHVLDVNLYGPWLGMHTAAPALRRTGGVIVNVSSTAGLMGYASLGAYVASKWGLRGLTKSAALDLAPDGVRVCSVHPGPIATPMTAGFDDSMVAAQPIPRFGKPEEVAAMIVFIATEATFSTGSEFVVDGGAVVGSMITA